MAWIKKRKKVEGVHNNTMFKKSKYFNNRFEKDGVKFDSDLEYSFYQKLLTLKEEGKIQSVVIHPDAIQLIPTQHTIINGKQKVLFKGVRYEPDFEVILNSGKKIILDTKSFRTITNEFKIKTKLVYLVHGIIVYTILKPQFDRIEKILQRIDENNYIQYDTKAAIMKYLEKENLL